MSRFTRTHCPHCRTPYVSRATACARCGKRREPFTPLELLIEELPEGVQLKHRLCGSSQTVYRIAFSPDGTTLASASANEFIRLWDVQTGVLLKTFPAHVRDAGPTSWGVCSVAFSPDGKTLVTGGFDKTVQLWDAQTGEHLQTLYGHTDWVNQASFSPDGKTIVSASRDKTIGLWDAHSGKLLQRLVGHTESVNTVLFSPNDQCLISGSDDKTIRFWDAQTGEALQVLSEKNNGPYYCLALSPDGTMLASASNCHFLSKGSMTGAITLWSAATGEVRQRLQRYCKPYQPPWLKSLAFSPDGQLLASREECVRLWQVETGQELALIHEPHAYSWQPNLVFHPQLPLLATVGSLPSRGRSRGYNCAEEIHLYNLDTARIFSRYNAQ